MTDEQKALDRLQRIAALLDGDATGEKLLDELVAAGQRYFEQVNRLEWFMRLRARRLEGEERRAEIERLDANRTRAHENLLASLYALNRYLVRTYEEVPPGGVFSRDPETIRNRVAVADWMGDLLSALYRNRRR